MSDIGNISADEDKSIFKVHAQFFVLNRNDHAHNYLCRFFFQDRKGNDYYEGCCHFDWKMEQVHQLQKLKLV